MHKLPLPLDFKMSFPKFKLTENEIKFHVLIPVLVKGLCSQGCLAFAVVFHYLSKFIKGKPSCLLP